MFDEVIQVHVGTLPDDKTYTIHKGVASHYSDYFAAATRSDSPFKESTEGIIHLPTERVSVFADFVNWLYTGSLPRSIDDQRPDYRVLCELWVLSDRRGVPLLMNVAINEIRQRFVQAWSLPLNQLEWIYVNTVPEAGLRRFMVAIFGQTGGPTNLQDSNPGMWPKDALWDVLGAVWKLQREGVTKRMSKEEVAKMEMCQYHVHDEGVKCGKD